MIMAIKKRDGFRENRQLFTADEIARYWTRFQWHIQACAGDPLVKMADEIKEEIQARKQANLHELTVRQVMPDESIVDRLEEYQIVTVHDVLACDYRKIAKILSNKKHRIDRLYSIIDCYAEGTNFEK